MSAEDNLQIIQSADVLRNQRAEYGKEIVASLIRHLSSTLILELIPLLSREQRLSSTRKTASRAAVSASGLPRAASGNLSGPETGFYRVVRGGSWDSDADYCRSAFRDYRHTSGRSRDLGFRLSRTV